MHTLIVGQVDGQEFKVYHMVVYPEIPSQIDIDSLRSELETDSEFGLQNQINDMEIRYLEIEDGTIH